MARRPKPWFRKDRGIWCVTINGVRHNLGAQKKAAFDCFYRLMRQPQQRQVSGQFLVAAIDSFLDWTQQHRAAATYEWYRIRLQRFAERYPDLATDALRPYHVQQWVDSFKLAQTSQRNCIRAVKRCLKWAQQQGYIEASPLEQLEAPSAERREILVTPDEYQQILAAITDPSFRDLVVTTWETGCRPQESLRVEARHVDLQKQRWVFQRAESKTKRLARVVYLNDTACEISKRLVMSYPVGRLFRNSDGKPWTNYAVHCAFRRVRMRLGKAEMRRQGIEISDKQVDALAAKLRREKTSNGQLVQKTPAELRCEAKSKLTRNMAIGLVPAYSLYALRHSWATRALERGIDSLTVAILMGHQDPSMLARVYQHLSLNPGHLLSEAKRVGA